MSQTLTPEVVWAQRSSPADPAKNLLYLTFVVPDVSTSDLDLKLTPTKLSYKGTNSKGHVYAIDIEFYEEIDDKESRHIHNGRATECIIRKKEAKSEFWPRLTKDKVKLHWLKTDFDKWIDEDEQDGPSVEPDFDPSMMSQFGGGDDAGGFGNIDFSKLGGGADLSGMGGGDEMEGLDDSDEEMPGLEGEEEKHQDEPLAEEASSSGKGKAKIEELD